MAQVHPLLIRAKALCEEFAVKPHGGKGFVVWRLRDWSHKRGGWRPEASTRTRESAEAAILALFGLAEPEEPKPPVPADAYFDFYGGAFP